MAWHSRMGTVRRSITAIKVIALLLLVEQGYEMLVLHVALAEHPLLVIAALGALGFPVPSKAPEQP
jgi:hypothetical protein